MSDAMRSLILDLLEWLGDAPRDYHEVMQAWRTSCPQLPVWEEANVRRLLEQTRDAGGRVRVALSPAGRELLIAHRPALARAPVERRPVA